MNKKTVLHPNALDSLFAYQSNVSTVFKDVLNLYDIDHIAVSYINDDHELLTFSSTPSLEFNLFNNTLWQFDQTYHSHWYSLGGSASWPSLYMQERYDELQYVKQVEYQYSSGISLAANVSNGYLLYSMASRKQDKTNDFFENETSLRKIGHYCWTLLMPLVESIALP